MQRDEQHRFRVTAAIGLAVACLTLGAPFALMHLGENRWPAVVGGLASTVMLCVHAVLMSRDSPLSRYSVALIAPLGIAYLTYLVHTFGILGMLWCFPGLLGLYCLLPERAAWVANAALLLLVMIVGWSVLEPAVLLRSGATLLAVSLFAGLLLRAVTEQFANLQRRIVTDPLTGLLNRYELEPLLETRLHSRRRADANAALLALDIDHFKQVNDQHGHAVGDDVLRRTGRTLCASIRSGDEAFRLGGEEFLVVLSDIDGRLAMDRAEKLRLALCGALSLPDHPITVSIGVAIAAPSDSWSHWMSRADDALYRAKETGRDRVCAALRADQAHLEPVSAPARGILPEHAPA